MRFTTLVSASNATVLTLFAATLLGCGASDDDDTSSTAPSAINGLPSFTDCEPEEEDKLGTALRYAFHRVATDAPGFRQCMQAAYLWENDGIAGKTIADMLRFNVTTQITCADLPKKTDEDGNVIANTNATAFVSSATSEEFHIDRGFIVKANVPRIAGVMVHEITHNRGFPHDSDVYYSNSVAEQAESCIADWRENAAVDNGYALFWNGARVGHVPNATRSYAENNCRWNDTTHSNKTVECFYNGRRIGYELFHDGARVGYEPALSKAGARANCRWNVLNHPSKTVECDYDGAALGYSLFKNSTRVGYEPRWSADQARRNCQWNSDRYPRDHIQCQYDGRNLGYELYWNGRRVGHNLRWSRDQARANCGWNRSTYRDDRAVADGLRAVLRRGPRRPRADVQPRAGAQQLPGQQDEQARHGRAL